MNETKKNFFQISTVSPTFSVSSIFSIFPTFSIFSILSVFSIFSIFSFPLFLFFGCSYGANFWITGDDDVDVRWENTDEAFSDLGNILTVGGSSYSFLVFTDIQFGKKGLPDTTELLSFLDDYATNHPTDPLQFALFLGDAAEHGKSGELKDFYALQNQLKEKLALKKIFSTLGNHDLYNEGLSEWKSKTQPGKQAFRFSVTATTSKGEIERSFYSIDTASSAFGSKQFNFFDKKLRADKTPKFILTHEPLHQMGDPLVYDMVCSFNQKSRIKMIQLLLETGVDFYFCGHAHTGGTYDWTEYTEYCFKSYTECQGKNHFYTAAVDEEAGILTIFRYENSSWRTGDNGAVSVEKFGL